MRTGLTRIFVATLMMALPAAARAQAPAADPNANIVVANPTHTTIPLESDFNKPGAEVWARIGKYCDIGEWLQIPGGCKMLSGAEGEVGSGLWWRKEMPR